ncbi:hypothetical protein VNO78_24091 [Psophocarpus tetragonolobus]|uniref:PPM-type phosphatase domain-containing protein n=1 Tax=Psophocarpus tetragonolobus TaxID=3891 RepID=A0AAN9S7W6_PSOTE
MEMRGAGLQEWTTVGRRSVRRGGKTNDSLGGVRLGNHSSLSEGKLALSSSFFMHFCLEFKAKDMWEVFKCYGKIKEEEVLKSLEDLVNPIQIDPRIRDRWVWMIDRSGGFTVAGASRSFMEVSLRDLRPLLDPSLLGRLWKDKLPSKKEIVTANPDINAVKHFEEDEFVMLACDCIMYSGYLPAYLILNVMMYLEDVISINWGLSMSNAK